MYQWYSINLRLSEDFLKMCKGHWSFSRFPCGLLFLNFHYSPSATPPRHSWSLWLYQFCLVYHAGNPCMFLSPSSPNTLSTQYTLWRTFHWRFAEEERKSRLREKTVWAECQHISGVSGCPWKAWLMPFHSGSNLHPQSFTHASPIFIQNPRLHHGLEWEKPQDLLYCETEKCKYCSSVLSHQYGAMAPTFA